MMDCQVAGSAKVNSPQHERKNAQNSSRCAEMKLQPQTLKGETCMYMLYIHEGFSMLNPACTAALQDMLYKTSYSNYGLAGTANWTFFVQ
eukprot:13823386-Ditylum_brightwellii.AAC.1